MSCILFQPHNFQFSTQSVSSLVTQLMMQCRRNPMELRSMDCFYVDSKKVSEKFLHHPPSVMILKKVGVFFKNVSNYFFCLQNFFNHIKTFGPKFHVLDCENENQSHLKKILLIKFSKVGLIMFMCESKTYFCYYWHFWTLRCVFEVKMIKKICLGVIRFEIGGLQRKLWRCRDVGLGHWTRAKG